MTGIHMQRRVKSPEGERYNLFSFCKERKLKGIDPVEGWYIMREKKERVEDDEMKHCGKKWKRGGRRT